MSRRTKRGEAEVPGFAPVHPFEPVPGAMGAGPDDLMEAGEVQETIPQGAYLALLGLMKSLKALRQSKGLSLTDVSERSRMTRQAISKLENAQTINPTWETLYRYGLALDAGLTLGFEEIEPEGEA